MGSNDRLAPALALASCPVFFQRLNARETPGSGGCSPKRNSSAVHKRSVRLRKGWTRLRLGLPAHRAIGSLHFPASSTSGCRDETACSPTCYTSLNIQNPDSKMRRNRAARRGKGLVFTARNALKHDWPLGRRCGRSAGDVFLALGERSRRLKS